MSSAFEVDPDRLDDAAEEWSMAVTDRVDIDDVASFLEDLANSEVVALDGWELVVYRLRDPDDLLLAVRRRGWPYKAAQAASLVFEADDMDASSVAALAEDLAVEANRLLPAARLLAEALDAGRVPGANPTPETSG